MQIDLGNLDQQLFMRQKRTLNRLVAAGAGLRLISQVAHQHLEGLQNLLDRVVDRIPDQFILPSVSFSDDFRLDRADPCPLTLEAQTVASVVMDCLEDHETSLAMSQVPRPDEIRLTGGGCRAFYPPVVWAELAHTCERGAILILCHDGGDLAPYCNPAYEQPDKVRTLEQALQAAGYARRGSHVVSGVYRL